MIKPNLFLVGFQKCGSSSLFNFLSQHRDILACKPKETFALADNRAPMSMTTTNSSTADINWLEFYDQKKTKYYLEGSVNNFYQEKALSYISNLPTKKVIFIVRDPIERFVSTFDYYGRKLTKIGYINNLSKYYDLILNNKDKLDNDGIKYSLEHGKYSEHISKWEAEIGMENVKVIGLKQLSTQHEIEIRSLFDFLQLPCPTNFEIPHINKTKNLKNRKLNYLLMNTLNGNGLGQTYAGILYRKLNTTKKRPKIDNDLKLILEHYYKNEYALFGDKF